MTATSHTPAAPNSHGSSVSVAPDAAGRILDDILRKPGKRGASSVRVQNKRRSIGQQKCTPGAAIVMCLADNGLVEEYCSALRVLLNPGAVRFEPITTILRHITATERDMGAPIESILMGVADTRAFSAIRDRARVLAEEAAQLSDDAAREQYTARRTA